MTHADVVCIGCARLRRGLDDVPDGIHDCPVCGFVWFLASRAPVPTDDELIEDVLRALEAVTK